MSRRSTRPAPRRPRKVGTTKLVYVLSGTLEPPTAQRGRVPRVSKAAFLLHRQQHPGISNARGARVLSAALPLDPPLRRPDYVRYKRKYERDGGPASPPPEVRCTRIIGTP